MIMEGSRPGHEAGPSRLPDEIDARASTPLMLLAGTAAGPMFLVLSLAHGLLRPGFSFHAHPPSALSLGGFGWIQTAAFLVAAGLLVLGAIGMRHKMTGSGSRWAPRLVALFGSALAAGGAFEMDPAFGFPPGTPSGVGSEISWHAALHGVMFPLGFGAVVAACVVMSRRFGRQSRRGWQWYCLLTAPVSLVLAIWPNLAAQPDGRFLPMWIGVILTFSWTSLIIDAIRRESRPAAIFTEAHR